MQRKVMISCAVNRLGGYPRPDRGHRRGLRGLQNRIRVNDIVVPRGTNRVGAGGVGVVPLLHRATDVDHHHVRLQSPGFGYCAKTIFRFTDDFDILRCFQQQPQRPLRDHQPGDALPRRAGGRDAVELPAQVARPAQQQLQLSGTSCTRPRTRGPRSGTSAIGPT